MTRTLSLLIAAVSLAGCASLNSLTSEVSSYSQWPADRKPGSYAFERLPSQQTRPQQQQTLEDSARPALEAAGFTPAADAASSEYVVALGARVNATEQYYDDPFWWRGGLYSHRFSRPWPYYGIGSEDLPWPQTAFACFRSLCCCRTSTNPGDMHRGSGCRPR